MIKQLLATAAIAAMAFSVNAEKTVLWTDAEGYAPNWGTAVMFSAEDVANVADGDIISMKAEAVEDGWHQLLIQAPRPDDDGGWVAIGGLGGLKAGDIVDVPIIPAISKYIHEYGLAVQGDGGVTIKEITVEKGTIEVGPNTIWFGPALSTWTMYSVRPVAFANVKEGDKIVVNYSKESQESALQLLFGGWGGLTLATYDNLPFFTVDEGNCQITCELVEGLASFEKDEKTYDAFNLLKDSGLSFQGSNIIINEISLVPAAEPVNYYAVGGFQDWNPATPAEFTYADGVFTLVAEKASSMKISTLYGDWDTFNSATIAPAGEADENGEIPFEVRADYQFPLDYEATWTVTIDPVKQTIKFTTDDPRPETAIYIRGGMNGWGADDAWKFSTTDGNIYTLDNVSIEAGTAFKVADANWGSVNYGTTEAIVPNTTVTLYYDGGNCQLAESVENATVIFNLTDKTLKIDTAGSGIESITSDTAAVYYNLQGVKVVNPTEGNIYVVKKGTKVSKVAF